MRGGYRYHDLGKLCTEADVPFLERGVKHFVFDVLGNEQPLGHLDSLSGKTIHMVC